MHERTRSLARALMAASCLIAPQAAHAATAREEQLEARLEKLETEMAQLRSDLAQARQQQVRDASAAQGAIAAANARSEAAATRIAAVEAKASGPATAAATAPAAPPADGFRSGNSAINIGGYIKLVATSSHFSDGKVATNTFGRDFYLPQAIPTGSGQSTDATDFNAKQSRLWVDVNTRLGDHALKAYVEADFQTSPGIQASKRTTNGYNFTLRRAYMQFDRWLIGQEWTTFQYVPALPESTDFVGVTEGTVFARQPLIRYSLPIGKQATLHLAMEQPETGTVDTGSPTIIENGDERIPDFVARLAWKGGIGELSLAGLARQVRVQNGGKDASTTGLGVSAAGKLWLNGSKTSDLRAMVTYGHNISRYLGLNFAPDAVYSPATNSLESVDAIAAFAALHIALGTNWRANVMGSWQRVYYSRDLAVADIATFNRQAWSGAANLFYSPYRNIDLGIEYRHGERDLVDGDNGNLDRLEFAAKYSF
ncbi:DcaP family trimeric outer membrane transporter [Novosphingobium sp. KA1]|uniref:DcaP family trimeric outer membrane transporter n=1 Tax=Novosphingobium sp. (strain KA1) TaxID=164608 RepID=UPI001F5DA30F|nr:DcaP family trimeric outer membrane transporter [Novosphingobium sp. KA1]